MTVVLDELQQLQPKTLTDPELGTGKHLAVFLKNGMRDIQAGRLRNGNQENSTLQPGGLYCSRNQNICIDHQTEGKHLLLRLLGADLPNNFVNLTRVQCTRAVSLRFFTEEP